MKKIHIFFSGLVLLFAVSLSYLESAEAGISKVWGVEYNQISRFGVSASGQGVVDEQVLNINGIKVREVICSPGNWYKCLTPQACESPKVGGSWWNDQCNQYSQAEIKIERGNTDIHTGDTYTFGETLEPGSESSVTEFTITNEGNLDLNLTGTPSVGISGADASHFEITPPAQTTLGGFETTTFTVKFVPKGEVGSRTATLTIENNDGNGDETNFTVIITGSVKACSAGYYLEETNQICAEAGAGYYSPAADNTRTECAAGRYGSSMTNSTASCDDACTAGYYCEAGSTTAQGQGECSEGYYCPSGSSSATQNECGIGNYCGVGSSTATSCPTNATTTTATSTSINDCVGNAGYYDCTDGTCDAADIGYYSEADSNDQTACAAGSYTGSTGQSSCTTCTTNYYCVGGADRQACDAGYESAEGSDAEEDCIDVVDPTVSDDYMHDGSWTTTDQTITLTAIDNQTGIQHTKYCWGTECDVTTGTTYAAPIQITTDTNDTLRYQTTDNDNNTSAIKTIEVQVDKTAPVCGDWTEGTPNWSADTLDYTLANSTDAFSTIDTAGGTCTTTPIGTTCDVMITDLAGNSTTCTSPTGTADTTDPTVTDDYASDDAWVTTDQTITLTPVDGESGVASTMYCWGTDCTPETAYTSPIVIDTNTNDTLRYQTTDNAGNTSAIGSTIVKVDKTNPVCGTWTEGIPNWANDELPYTLASSTDAFSGIATAGGTCTTTPIGTTCDVTITDLAGNSTTCTSPTGTADTTDPTVTDDYASDDVWVTTDQTITLTATDALSGVDVTKYCWGATCDLGSGSTYTTPIEITTNTNDTLRYQTTDNAGNESSIKTIAVQIDKDAPVCGEWTKGTEDWGGDELDYTLANSTDAFSTINTAGGTCTTSPIGTTCTVDITDTAGNSTTCTSPAGTADTTDPTVTDDYASDDSWVTTDQTITLTPADEGGSDVANTKYCWGTTCTPSTTYTTPIVIDTNTNDTLRYQTTDNAGNESTIGSTIVKLDKTNPVCGTWTPDPVDWTNTTPQTFTLAGSTDSYSDIATAGGVCDVATDGATCTVQIADNAGNTLDCTSPTSKIDQTDPTASDNYTNDGTWVNTNQSITISSADTGGSNLKETKYCWGTTCIPSTLYASAISVTSNTDDTLRYQSFDNAGNESTIGSTDVKVNKTAPTITLTGDASITLTQGDTYTEQGATCSDDIDGSSAATVGGDTVDTATLGTYTVTYNCTDSAGNPATQEERTITVNGIPEINITQGTTDIASGGTYDFGSVVENNSSSATFTIENTGNGDLTLSGSPKVVLSGTNASEYTVNESSTTATVAGGSTTTFEVTFSPTSAGSKTATLAITNNDSDEGSYVINLTGAGAEDPRNDPSSAMCTPFADDFVLRSTPLGSVTSYYEETKCTGLKWATADQNTSVQWATDTSYGEPTWNGSSYDYPTGRTEADYPAFAHCTDLGASWRLPTSGELESIIDRQKSSGPYTHLPTLASAVYWSSVQFRANTNSAWYASMRNGQVALNSKNGNYRVVCVSE